MIGSSRKKKITHDVLSEKKLLEEIKIFIKIHTSNQEKCNDEVYQVIKKRYKEFAKYLQANNIDACATMAMFSSSYRGRPIDFGNYFVSFLYLTGYNKGTRYVVLENSEGRSFHLCILDVPKEKMPKSIHAMIDMQDKWVYDVISNSFFKMKDILNELQKSHLKIVQQSYVSSDQITVEETLQKAKEISELMLFQDTLVADLNFFHEKCMTFYAGFKSGGLILSHVFNKNLLDFMSSLNEMVFETPLDKTSILTLKNIEINKVRVIKAVKELSPEKLDSLYQNYEKIKASIEQKIAGLNSDLQNNRRWTFSLPEKYSSMFIKSIPVSATVPDFYSQKVHKKF